MEGERECPGCGRMFPVDSNLQRECYIEHLDGHIKNIQMEFYIEHLKYYSDNDR